MRPNPIIRFSIWVLVLSVPFYVWGVAAHVRGLLFGLPATSIMVIIPAVVATGLQWLEFGPASALGLWMQVFDVRRIPAKGWLTAAILIMPIASLASYAVMRIANMPLPQTVHLQISLVPAMFIVYFLGAILEEIGWTAYLTGPLQRQFGLMRAGLLIGSVWAAWHVIPWWLGQGHTPQWVLGQITATILMRLAMGFLYARGGRSLFLAIVFHTMINVSYSIFPNAGSHYDPGVLSVTLASALIVARLFATARRQSSISR